MRTGMQDYRNLKTWQKGHDQVLAIYRITARFPKEEVYGLTSQLRRAALSIPTNLAEGCGRRGDPELAYFLAVAMGSAFEVDYLLMAARDLGYLNGNDYDSLQEECTRLRRMLSAFMLKLKANSPKPRA
jgi:four helix bundle protein